MTRSIYLSEDFLTGSLSDLPYASRLAWVTVLFEAEECRGRVLLTVRHLAKRTTITMEEAEAALSAFLAPDPYAGHQDNDGRRLVPIDGKDDQYQVVGWDRYVQNRNLIKQRLRQGQYRARVAATHCACCGDEFADSTGMYAVDDHDHGTGRRRGTVCRSCNAVIGLVEKGRPSKSERTPLAQKYIARYQEQE